MKTWHHVDNWHEPLGLHPPCRGPVDHFLSQVNHLAHHIDCTAFEPHHAARYVKFMERFEVAHVPKIATVRCAHFAKLFSDYAAMINLPNYKKRGGR